MRDPVFPLAPWQVALKFLHLLGMPELRFEEALRLIKSHMSPLRQTWFEQPFQDGPARRIQNNLAALENRLPGSLPEIQGNLLTLLGMCFEGDLVLATQILSDLTRGFENN